MAALTLTTVTDVGPNTGILAARLVDLRRSLKIGGAGAGGETGLQRIGPLTSNGGTTHLVYYDPAADALISFDGYPPISQG